MCLLFSSSSLRVAWRFHASLERLPVSSSILRVAWIAMLVWNVQKGVFVGFLFKFEACLEVPC